MGLDWSKNSRGSDHGALFQSGDRKRVRSDQIDYDYYAENDEELAPNELALVRPLKDVLPRLELLGFTIERAKSEYIGAVEEEMWEDGDEDGDADEPPDLMSFEEFCAFVAAHPVENLDDTFIGYSGAEREAKVRGRFADDTVARRLPYSSLHGTDAYSERSYFGGLIGILHPYSVLRVLGVNAENREADVVWQYGPLVQSGWATEAEFTPGARRTQTFLVATEGSSDAHILKHAFAILRPEIADFFRFIDVSERHPFPGTGNLLKFAEGLAKIDVQNQVVFLLDNDAEGFDAYQRVQNLSLPSNMRAIMLPDLDAFRAFPARGPEGVRRRSSAIWISISADIHRRKSCGRTTGRSSMSIMGRWNSRTPTPRSF